MERLGEHLRTHDGTNGKESRKEEEREDGSRQKRHHISLLVPKQTPCGCELMVKSRQQIQGQFIILEDGSRVCRHGKRWVLKWENRKLED